MATEDRIAVGMAILELILRYGVPLAIEMIKALETDNPSVEDIRSLAGRVQHPDTFEGGPS